MGKRWENFIDNMKDDTKSLAKDEIKDLVKSAKDDSDEFIKRQGMKLELYICQLASGQITKDQFEMYVQDLKDITEMHTINLAVSSKARAQRLVQGITNLIINGLLTLL